MLDAVDLAAPFDLDRDRAAVDIATQQVDRTDIGRIFAPHETQSRGDNGGVGGQKNLQVRFDAVLHECKAIQGEAEAAQREFDANPSAAGVRKLAALRPQAVVASEIFASLYRSVGARANDEFNREHAKDLRAVLLTASKFKLTQAQKEFEIALAHARETLGAEGFDADEISESPKVRAAKWQVEKLERLVASIESSTEGTLWQHAGQILEK